MKIVQPARSALICLLFWFVWTLTNRGWIGEIPCLRTWADYPYGAALIFLLMALASLVLSVRHAFAMRHASRRSQAISNLLCLGLAAAFAFTLPSKAVTMFTLWRDEFLSLAQSPPFPLTPKTEHWTYGSLRPGVAPQGGSTLVFDYGDGVAALLYNPHDQPVLDETQVLCDPERREGGFTRRLERNWFLCYRLR